MALIMRNILAFDKLGRFDPGQTATRDMHCCRLTPVVRAGIVALWALLVVGAFVQSPAQAAGDAAAGASKASMCVACHGAQGEGKDKSPALAGKDAAFLEKELQNFRSGARQDPMKMMNMMAKPLSDQDIANLAAHFASLKGK